MATNNNVLGMDCVFYRNNNGTYGSPSWNAVENIKDVEINMETDQADLTTRKNNGWKAKMGTLKDGSISFSSIWDHSDADFNAFFNAFMTKSLVDCAILNGNISLDNSQGLRAYFSVTKCSRKEPLAEGVMADITIAPGYHAIGPAWVASANGSLSNATFS